MPSFERFNNNIIQTTANRRHYSKPYMKFFKQPKCGCYKGRFNTCLRKGLNFYPKKVINESVCNQDLAHHTFSYLHTGHCVGSSSCHVYENKCSNILADKLLEPVFLPRILLPCWHSKTFTLWDRSPPFQVTKEASRSFVTYLKEDWMDVEPCYLLFSAELELAETLASSPQKFQTLNLVDYKVMRNYCQWRFSATLRAWGVWFQIPTGRRILFVNWNFPARNGWRNRAWQPLSNENSQSNWRNLSEDNETGVDLKHHWKNRIDDIVLCIIVPIYS